MIAKAAETQGSVAGQINRKGERTQTRKKEKDSPLRRVGCPSIRNLYCCGGFEVPLLLLLPVLDPALGGLVLGLPLFGELLGLVLLGLVLLGLLELGLAEFGLLESGLVELGLLELGLLVLDPLLVLDGLLVLGEADELSGEVVVLDPLLLLGLLVLGLLLLCELLELVPVLGEAEV